MIRDPFMGVGLAALAALAATTPASAQEAGSRQSREYLAAAAQTDTFELLAARAALVQSSNPQVRGFAQHMIEAHQRTRTSLLDAASRSRMKPPDDSIDGDQARLLAAMQDAHSPAFDRVYARSQVVAHHGALATTELFARSGDDRNLRAAATQAQPIIAEHITMADRLATQVGTDN